MRPPHTPYYIIVRQGRSILIAKRGRCGLVGILGRAAGVAVSRRPRPHKENPWGARASRFVPEFSIVARLAGKSLEKFNGRRGHSGDRRHAPRDASHDLGDRKNDLGDRFFCRPSRFLAFWPQKKGSIGGPMRFAKQRYNIFGRNANRPRRPFFRKMLWRRGRVSKTLRFWRQ